MKFSDQTTLQLFHLLPSPWANLTVLANSDEASKDFPVLARYASMIRSVSITRMVGLLIKDAVLSACIEAATDNLY